MFHTTTRISSLILAILMMTLTTATYTGTVYGDSWVAPPATRMVWAMDRTAKAIVTSGTDNGWDKTHSRISVWRIEANEPDKLVWEGNLVNIPHKFFVSSKAKSVVTMDRWGSIGHDPIVFYDSNGHVIHHYIDAKELLTEKEVPRIKQTISSFWWSEEACAEFTVDGDYFLLWLPWRRVLVFQSNIGKEVEAKSFQLVSKNRKLQSKSRKIIFDTVDRLKKSENPDERIKAARFAGWLQGLAILPILRELMKDPYYKDGSWEKAEDPWQRFGDSFFWVCPRAYPVRKAAAEEMHISFGQAEGVIKEWIAR